MRGCGTLLAGVALLLVGGGARLAYIQARQGEELRQRAERQQRVTRVIPARRGEILDTRGRVLAGTVRRPSAFVDPYLVRDARFAAYSVAPVLGLSAAELERELVTGQSEGVRFRWLKRRLDETQVAALLEVTRSRRLRAFDILDEPTRIYPLGRVAAHVLGFVGVDAQGLAGVELAYDEVLTGTPGRRVATVDVARRRVRADDEEFEPAIDGATVILTIDTYVQQITQNALRRAFDKHQPEWATAVVMDPLTGEVLAMANLPDFDPQEAIPANFNELSEAQREAHRTLWRNRAVSDSYEPGSAFKPFIAASALQEGLVRLDEVFAINGPVRTFGRRPIRDTHAYSALAVHEIISKSSNIGMGLIGARCGMQRLHGYVRAFGFGAPTGIELPGEHSGLVQDFSRWNPSFSPQSIPIGQEIAVTPIQLVTGFSAFCNGGLLLRPRVVRGIIAADGQTLADYSTPVVARRVLDERTAEEFRLRALVETVRQGTGKLAALEEYQVFGKTGTAQIAAPGGRGYQPGQYVATFVGGAPAGRPRVAVVVSVYKPTKEGYYGGVVAAPVVKEIIAETLAYMQVPAELTPTDEAGSPRAVRGSARTTTDD